MALEPGCEVVGEGEVEVLAGPTAYVMDRLCRNDSRDDRSRGRA